MTGSREFHEVSTKAQATMLTTSESWPKPDYHLSPGSTSRRSCTLPCS